MGGKSLGDKTPDRSDSIVSRTEYPFENVDLILSCVNLIEFGSASPLRVLGTPLSLRSCPSKALAASLPTDLVTPKRPTPFSVPEQPFDQPRANQIIRRERWQLQSLRLRLRNLPTFVQYLAVSRAASGPTTQRGLLILNPVGE